MRIGTNGTINMAYNILNSTNKAMEKSVRAISTGLKAAHAEDDASGFAIGLGISANRSAVDRAMRNAQDGISMLQTAEGGLNQINSMLQRMRELTVQAANDTLTSQDRNYLQMEMDELRGSIDNMANNTTFNNRRLLDGSSAAIWSSSDSGTKLKINGALTVIDDFGQKKTADGNYRIEVKAHAGQGQVQKSAPMIIARKDTASYRQINGAAGVNDMSIANLPTDYYTITGTEQGSASATLTGYYGTDPSDNISANIDSLDVNASILFEVTASDDGTLTLSASSRVMTTDGLNSSYSQGNIMLSEGNSIDLSELIGTEEGTFMLELDSAENFKVGNKFVYQLTPDTGNRTVNISRTESEISHTFSIDTEALMNEKVHFRSFYLDSETGKEYDSDITLTTSDEVELPEGQTYAEFTTKEIGDIPEYDTKLQDIDTFYDAQGIFMLERPQTITLTQGDGKETSIKVYSTDKIGDIITKLNDAIAEGLGQKIYTDDKSNFVDFVLEDNIAPSGSEAVAGTFVIRSAVAGSAGKITLSSDNNDLINALGLNTIQDGIDNTFTATVYDAHTGDTLASNMPTQGNRIYGVISPNVEIEFDAMANVRAIWDDSERAYNLFGESGTYSTMIHISDRSTAFQIGARDGEDMYINIGDMRSEALGLNRVDISTRSRASESISVLDAAIRKVSLQRTKLGAYQNEIEYNYNSLAQTSLHLQESESRIRDADMATEAIEFMKLQILSNTGNSMLAQANQNSQAVINLLNL